MTLRRALQITWALPIAIPMWAVGVLPLWALGRLTFVRWERPGIASFRSKRMAGTWWWGYSVPCAAIYCEDVVWYAQPAVIRHEVRHCEQIFWFGPLFYPAYAVASLWAAARGRDFYRDNWFEADARRHSGEQLLRRQPTVDG